MREICCWAGFFPHLHGFPQTVRFGECAGQSIHGGSNKQDERRGNIFGKMGDTGHIIQGDNSAGHFCNKGFNSNKLFQVSRGYETEIMHNR